MMLDTEAIRQRSLETAIALGYPTNPSLPLSGAGLVLRPIDQVVDRVLVLHVMIASTYRYSVEKGQAYLEQEGLWNAVTPEEQIYLERGDSDPEALRAQVEAVNAITWALGVTPKMSFDQPADKDLVRRLPNLKVAAPSAPFREAARFRPLEDIAGAGDLVYCLHWALRECQLTGQQLPGKIYPYVIIERRRAFDWMLKDEDWDEVSLDT